MIYVTPLENRADLRVDAVLHHPIRRHIYGSTACRAVPGPVQGRAKCGRRGKILETTGAMHIPRLAHQSLAYWAPYGIPRSRCRRET